MPRPEYRFVPVTRADFAMLRRWLAEPHLGGWWGDPDTEIALIEEDMQAGPTDMRIVYLGATPFAYVQDYPAHHWPAPQFDGLPPGTRAMDTFLGNPGFLGQGHAAGYLRQRAEALLAGGAAAVVVDPDPANARAVACYARAGFTGDRVRPCEDGAPVRVMLFRPAQHSAARDRPEARPRPAARPRPTDPARAPGPAPAASLRH